MQARVDIWYVDLAGAPTPTEAELSLLDDDERRRHARYLVADAARIFATTRLALRRLIGARVGQHPREVRLALDAHGKPFAPDHAELSFNVTHCDAAALLALSDADAVGVDMEIASKSPAPATLAGIICSDSELAWLRAHADAADATLERLWCRKEAIAKAWGTGLARPPSCIDTRDPALTAGTLETCHMPSTTWRDLCLAPSQIGAVAVVSSAPSRLDVTMRSFDEMLAGEPVDH